MESGENKRMDDNNKLKYILTAKEGTIIAFDLPDGSTKSACIVERDEDKQEIVAQTEYGAIFKVNFKDVLWVKTGRRFPKGVYNKLKKNVV